MLSHKRLGENREVWRAFAAALGRQFIDIAFHIRAVAALRGEAKRSLSEAACSLDGT